MVNVYRFETVQRIIIFIIKRGLDSQSGCVFSVWKFYRLLFSFTLSFVFFKYMYLRLQLMFRMFWKPIIRVVFLIKMT